MTYHNNSTDYFDDRYICVLLFLLYLLLAFVTWTVKQGAGPDPLPGFPRIYSSSVWACFYQGR